MLGPSYFESTWLNKEYFGDGLVTASADRHPGLNSYTFSHIEKANAQRIQSIVNVIGFELEGVICGLMNGKLALHHSGKLLKTCQVESEKHDEIFPITFNIVNFQTKEILAKLSMVFDKKIITSLMQWSVKSAPVEKKSHRDFHCKYLFFIRSNSGIGKSNILKI